MTDCLTQDFVPQWPEDLDEEVFYLWYRKKSTERKPLFRQRDGSTTYCLEVATQYLAAEVEEILKTEPDLEVY